MLPGSLFMVGDPKQAIYRFRGADIATYRLAREAVERQFPGNVLRVASNFRSCGDILQHINRCFEAPLQGQETGYVALEATRHRADHGLPCVAKVRVDVPPDSRVNEIREVEARVVAETCARLIGNVRIIAPKSIIQSTTCRRSASLTRWPDTSRLKRCGTFKTATSPSATSQPAAMWLCRTHKRASTISKRF